LCSNFHCHSPSTFVPNLYTNTLDSIPTCSTRILLFPTKKNCLSVEKKKLIWWWGDAIVTCSHKSPTLSMPQLFHAFNTQRIEQKLWKNNICVHGGHRLFSFLLHHQFSTTFTPLYTSRCGSLVWIHPLL
jgi:hypothetical protein